MRRMVWSRGKSAQIYSETEMPKNIHTLSDSLRGMLAGEGREAWAREQCVKLRVRIGRWRLELLREKGEEE